MAQDTNADQSTNQPEVASPQVENANESQIIVQSSEETSQPQIDKTEANIKAEQGKMSALEKERNRYSKEASEARKELEAVRKSAQALEVINNVYADSPEAYESFRQSYIKQGGDDLGDYRSRFGKEPPLTEAPVQAVRPEDVNAIVNQTIEQREGVNGFMDKMPDLDIRKVNREDPEFTKRYEDLSRIARLAGAIKREYPNKTMTEAMESAAYSIPEIREKMIAQARKTGEFSGKATAFASGVGTGGVSGTSGGGGEDVIINLNKTQMAKYEEIKANSGKKIADRFARNIASA